MIQQLLRLIVQISDLLNYHHLVELHLNKMKMKWNRVKMSHLYKKENKNSEMFWLKLIGDHLKDIVRRNHIHTIQIVRLRIFTIEIPHIWREWWTIHLFNIDSKTRDQQTWQFWGEFQFISCSPTLFNSYTQYYFNIMNLP